MSNSEKSSKDNSAPKNSGNLKDKAQSSPVKGAVAGKVDSHKQRDNMVNEGGKSSKTDTGSPAKK